MKKLIIFFILFVSMLNVNAQLKVVTKSGIIKGETKTEKSVYSTLNDEYIEVKLSLMHEPKDVWQATMRQITEYDEKLDGYKYSIVWLVSSNNNIISFTTPIDFLNYISKQGYNIFSQEKSDFSVKYVLKKK